MPNEEGGIQARRTERKGTFPKYDFLCPLIPPHPTLQPLIITKQKKQEAGPQDLWQSSQTFADAVSTSHLWCTLSAILSYFSILVSLWRQNWWDCELLEVTFSSALGRDT